MQWMKRVYVRYLATGAAAALLVGAAAVPAVAVPVANPVSQAAHQQAIALGGMHQDYQEYNNGSMPGIGVILDREDGSVRQVCYNLSAMRKRALGNFAIGYASGDTHYEGHSLSTGAPMTDTTHNNILSVRGDLGYAVVDNPNELLAPQVEFGYHAWTRHIDGTGQEEKYTHMQVGLGLRAYYALTNRLVVNAAAFVGKTLDPRISGTAVFYADAQGLGEATYRRAAVGVDYRLGDAWHLGLAADYQIWRYGHSAPFVVGYNNASYCCMVEPDSRTVQTTYLLSVGHRL